MNLSNKINQLALVGIGLLGLSGNLFADERPASDIVIDRGVVAADKIAIAEFEYDGVSPNYRIDKIIGDDLQRSGRFDPVYSDKFPTSVNTLNPRDWTDQDILYLVTGKISSSTSGGFKVTYKLFDLTGVKCPLNTGCFTKSVEVSQTRERDAGHNAANDVFEKLTNIKGDFLSKLAFVRQRIPGVDQYELYVSDYDGYNAKKIYTSKKPIMSPTWFANNSAVAFTTFTTFESVILKYDLNTGKTSTLVKALGNNSAPAINGNFLAYSHGENGRFDIYLKNLITGQTTNLTKGVGNNTEPSWAGNSIVFTSTRGGNPAIYFMNANGGNPYKVSKAAGQVTNADVSVAANLLAYIKDNRIYIQNLKTGTAKDITDTYLDESLTLSKNGYMLVYSSTAGRNKILNLISADGLFRARLPFQSGVLSYPAFSK